MLCHADHFVLHEAHARGARYRAEALDAGPVEEARAGAEVPRVREVLAGGLARLARRLAAVAEDLDPQVGRPRWQPRA
jgi:hypothetical protein